MMASVRVGRTVAVNVQVTDDTDLHLIHVDGPAFVYKIIVKSWPNSH